MDDFALREFISAARWQSFTKATKEMHVSQPAFSKHMASLEKKLSVQLFSRDSGEVRLTPIGKIFLKHAKQIVLCYDEALEQLANLRKQEPMHITIERFIPHYPSESCIQDLETDLGQQYPLLDIETKSVGNASPIQNVCDGRVDMCFAITKQGTQPEGLEMVPFYREPVVALVEKTHRLAEKRLISASDLKDEVIWLIQHPAYVDYVDAIRQVLQAHIDHPTFKYATWESIQGIRWDFTFGTLVGLASVLPRETSLSVRKNYAVLSFDETDMEVEVNAFYRTDTKNKACIIVADYLKTYAATNHISSIWKELPGGWYNSPR